MDKLLLEGRLTHIWNHYMTLNIKFPAVFLYPFQPVNQREGFTCNRCSKIFWPWALFIWRQDPLDVLFLFFVWGGGGEGKVSCLFLLISKCMWLWVFCWWCGTSCYLTFYSSSVLRIYKVWDVAWRYDEVYGLNDLKCWHWRVLPALAATPCGDRSKFSIQDVGVKIQSHWNNRRWECTRIFHVRKMRAVSPKNLPKERKFTYLEDRGMSFFDTCWKTIRSDVKSSPDTFEIIWLIFLKYTPEN